MDGHTAQLAAARKRTPATSRTTGRAQSNSGSVHTSNASLLKERSVQGTPFNKQRDQALSSQSLKKALDFQAELTAQQTEQQHRFATPASFRSLSLELHAQSERGPERHPQRMHGLAPRAVIEAIKPSDDRETGMHVCVRVRPLQQIGEESEKRALVVDGTGAKDKLSLFGHAGKYHYNAVSEKEDNATLCERIGASHRPISYQPRPFI